MKTHGISDRLSYFMPLRLIFSDSSTFFPLETPKKSEALKNINKSVLGLGLLKVAKNCLGVIVKMAVNVAAVVQRSKCHSCHIACDCGCILQY